ncbi:outer membrane protein [Nitrobacter winogradskyi Nb-255]|uniref:Outer membrane protein n=1 Tax=Nitrobacter winogradskyi (strain ATCC 25391 / DSM 10237 / CIP 104748 / NCIMB 11846 / Nb-255) TaxID=323098 RepID=Q3SRK5_NITWN|nr:autotransporter outer membrane beta-barrel domain-containing protein [Nitrobacter winogradskyi]ABA05086.1 outer membrane protein [Nitrobacter winogradskyi Nb-255]
MAPTGERLRGAYKASVFSGRIEAGWRVETALAGVTPYAAAQAISYRLPSYLEQGNGAIDSFALGYVARNVSAPRSELGLRLDRTTVMADALLTWRGRAAWARNFNTARDVAATFQSLPGTGFLVSGAAMAPDAALVPPEPKSTGATASRLPRTSRASSPTTYPATPARERCDTRGEKLRAGVSPRFESWP